jgi:hypothetical protein
MAIVKIKLTKDILTLITNIHYQEVPDLKSDKYPLTWGINFFSLYGGSYVLEDIAYIIGRYDEHIPGTEEDPLGPRFPQELEDYMYDMHEYIVNNIEYIEDLVHYYSNKGGLKEGTYKCHSHAKDWEFIG